MIVIDVFYCVIVLFTLVLGILCGEYQFIVIFIVECIVFIAALISNYYIISKLSITVSSKYNEVVSNQRNIIYLNINNMCVFGTPRCVLLLSYENAMYENPVLKKVKVPIVPHGSQKIGINIASRVSGKINVKVKMITTWDFLFLSKFKSKLDKTYEYYVFPVDEPNVSIECNTFDTKDDNYLYSDQMTGSDNGEVFGLREYHDGDRINQIHWKASSKQDKLIVKEYSQPVNPMCFVLVELKNIDKEEYIVDRNVSHAYNSCKSLLKDSIPFTLCWYDIRENELVRFSINNKSEFNIAIQNLLSAKVYEEGCSGIEYINELSTLSSNNMIYCSYVSKSTSNNDGVVSGE